MGAQNVWRPMSETSRWGPARPAARKVHEASSQLCALTCLPEETPRKAQKGALSMNRQIVLVGLLALSGCEAKQGVREASEELAKIVAEAIQAGLLEHPNQARVLSGLHCEQSQECISDDAFAGTGCTLDVEGVDPQFQANYLGCLQECGKFAGCYSDSVARLRASPSANERLERCRAATWQCNLDTDACDAFLVFSEPAVLDVLDDCSDSSCKDLPTCQPQALLGDLSAEED